MTNWRPPRSVVERNARALRSMQNGTLDGRIVGSFPVKQRIEDDYDLDEETEEEASDPGNPGSGGAGTTYPITDYFTYRPGRSHVYRLSKEPVTGLVYLNGSWSGSDERGKASVHVYWNNILQRDQSYLLNGNTLIIVNAPELMKNGDIITVKYWWKENGGGGGGGTGRIVTSPLEGWFSGGDRYQRFFGLGGDGVHTGTPGRNGGPIGTYSTLYSTTGFLSNFYGAVRLPTGRTLDASDATSAVIQLRFPNNADVSTFYYSNTNSVPGSVIASKPDCGLGSPVVGTIPSNSPPYPEGEFRPTIVGGGITTHTGDAALSFASLLDTRVGFDGTNLTIPITCKDGWGSSMRSNSGCGYDPLDDPTFFDDTIYGRFTMHDNRYDGTFGGTVSVFIPAEG